MQEPDAIPRASVPQQGFKIDHSKSFSLARTETSMRRIWGPLMFRGTSWLLYSRGHWWEHSTSLLRVLLTTVKVKKQNKNPKPDAC